jgi:hypothetical protein
MTEAAERLENSSSDRAVQDASSKFSSRYYSLCSSVEGGHRQSKYGISSTGICSVL